MSRDTFDAVLASAPNGAVAGRVTGKGEHWTPARAMPPGLIHSASPLALRPYRSSGGSLEDLRGQRIGRFTVVGLFDDPVPSHGARWVVRCVCGDYEVRKTKALRAMRSNPRDESLGASADRCHNCQELARINWKYRREGGRPISDFFTEVK